MTNFIPIGDDTLLCILRDGITLLQRWVAVDEVLLLAKLAEEKQFYVGEEFIYVAYRESGNEGLGEDQ